jgi:hypothetical protein
MNVWCAGVHTCTPNGHLYRVIYTRCRIDTINSFDDGHMAARNMYRVEINIHGKELYIKLVIYNDYFVMLTNTRICPKWQCENFKTCIVYNIRLLRPEITFNSCCILLFSRHNGMFKSKNIASWSSWPGLWNDELLLARREFFFFPGGTWLSSYSSDFAAIPIQLQSAFRLSSRYRWPFLLYYRDHSSVWYLHCVYPLLHPCIFKFLDTR